MALGAVNPIAGRSSGRGLTDLSPKDVIRAVKGDNHQTSRSRKARELMRHSAPHHCKSARSKTRGRMVEHLWDCKLRQARARADRYCAAQAICWARGASQPFDIRDREK